MSLCRLQKLDILIMYILLYIAYDSQEVRLGIFDESCYMPPWLAVFAFFSFCNTRDIFAFFEEFRFFYSKE